MNGNVFHNVKKEVSLISLHSLEKLVEWKLITSCFVCFGLDALHSLEKLVEWKLDNFSRRGQGGAGKLPRVPPRLIDMEACPALFGGDSIQPIQTPIERKIISVLAAARKTP